METVILVDKSTPVTRIITQICLHYCTRLLFALQIYFDVLDSQHNKSWNRHTYKRVIQRSVKLVMNTIQIFPLTKLLIDIFRH